MPAGRQRSWLIQELRRDELRKAGPTVRCMLEMCVSGMKSTGWVTWSSRVWKKVHSLLIELLTMDLSAGEKHRKVHSISLFSLETVFRGSHVNSPASFFPLLLLLFLSSSRIFLSAPWEESRSVVTLCKCQIFVLCIQSGGRDLLYRRKSWPGTRLCVWAGWFQSWHHKCQSVSSEEALSRPSERRSLCSGSWCRCTPGGMGNCHFCMRCLPVTLWNSSLFTNACIQVRAFSIFLFFYKH